MIDANTCLYTDSLDKPAKYEVRVNKVVHYIYTLQVKQITIVDLDNKILTSQYKLVAAVL